MEVTPALLEMIYGRPRGGGKFALWAPILTEVGATYHLDTPQRLAAFLAQIGHESGRLRYTRELWGPTAQQKRYEPPSSLAKTLGNTQPGDGRRFMGHGLIQVTGRANHRLMTARLRKSRPDLRVPDFEADPAALADPLWAALSAGEFWSARGLNRLADEGDLVRLTRRINGGTNGLADRQALYSQALPACILNWS